ncbi:hypothetical protein H4218_006106 [Coemansia sp. IMI 209128]|nr:hypothetical protein H4218_006106 [Coemansia sp. IMI 209128]
MVGLVLHPFARALPCDVVNLIVRAFYTYHVALTVRGFPTDPRFGLRLRRLVPLASVDSQWRHAVLPLLYRTLVCEEYAGGRRSNLGLFAAKGRRRWVRHLLVLGGGNAGELLSVGWPGLEQMSVVGGFAGVEFMRESVDLQALSRVNAPCVSMRLMNSHCAITHLWVGGDALPLVRRIARDLVSLRVGDIADGVELLAVLGDAHFQALEALTLEFRDASPGSHVVGDVRPLAVPGCFPALRALVVRHCPFDVRVCLAAIGGASAGCGRLGRLEVYRSRADVLALAESRAVLPPARSVVVACVGVARAPVDQAERFVAAALSNRSLFSVGSLSLTVIGSRPVAFVEGVACVGLRALELRVPLRLDVAERLLEQMPRLQRLCLPYVATEATMLSVRKGGVLSKSLQLLSMGFWDCRQDLRALSLAVIAFVGRLPELRTLVHDSHVAAAVRRMIGGNDQLRNLVITDHTKLSF